MAGVVSEAVSKLHLTKGGRSTLSQLTWCRRPSFSSLSSSRDQSRASSGQVHFSTQYAKAIKFDRAAWEQWRDMKPSSVKPLKTGRVVRDFTPLPKALAPTYSRAGYFFFLWLVKFIATIRLSIRTTKSKDAPTLTKYYPSRPALQVRIFFPESFSNSKDKPDLIPLYIDIHGGGFAVGNAAVDDEFCKSWVQRTGMIVASLNYSKTPGSPFPIPVHDIAALASAVIDDPSLAVDKSRVVMGGFSAGGNLCLAASLLPELQGKVKASVSYYPIVDWAAPPHVKYANRLFTEHSSDTIATAGPFLDWGYVPAGQDRKEKLLSPYYAEPSELAESVCIVAAQHDMLCREARDMMYSLADQEIPESGWEDGFEEGPYKWVMVKGVKHGFTHDVAPDTGPAEEQGRSVCERMYADVAKWLEARVLKPKKD